VPHSKISKKYQRSSLTLRRWLEQGKIKHIITLTARHTHSMHQVEQILGKKNCEKGSSAMPECPQENKKKTCNDRSSASKANIQDKKSSKKLKVAPTSKQRDSKSAWTSYVQEWSQKWSSCRERLSSFGPNTLTQ
jgi:hypothetical protein